MPATYTIKESGLQSGGGGRGPVNPREYGGGGGDRGGGAPSYGERLRRYRLGVAVALVPVVMVFVIFTITFLFRAHVAAWDIDSGAYVRDWHPVQLPVTLLAVNTLLLAISSLTLELARREAARRMVLAPLRSIPGIAVSPAHPVPWLPLTVVLGTAFLAGQAMVWHMLPPTAVEEFSRAASSFVYILTGVHAIHLFAGWLALLYAMAASSLLAKPLEVRSMVVDITAWYWHVMTVLWMYIFALLLLSY